MDTERRAPSRFPAVAPVPPQQGHTAEQRQLGQQYEATLRERAEGVERDLRREVEMLTAPQLSSRLVTETQALAAETRMKTEVAAAHATAPLPDVLECPGDGPPPEPFTL